MIEVDDQALNWKWQISLPVVQDMLTLIAIRIICLSHGSSFASMNNKLVFLRICYLLCSIFVITAYKNTRYAHTYYMIKKYTIYIYTSTILDIDTLIPHSYLGWPLALSSFERQTVRAEPGRIGGLILP